MQIFKLIKKVFFLGLTILSNFTNALDCISMKNRECKVRSEIININSNNPMFYPFSVKINKCSDNCNNINDPYARICVPDTTKDLKVKVFNLMSKTNETRQIKGMNHESAYIDQTKLFVTIDRDGIKINVDANAKN